MLTNTIAPPAEVAVVQQRAEAPAPQPDPVRVRVWVLQREWDAAAKQNAITEAKLCEPIAFRGVLDWSSAAPWETALVPVGTVLEALRAICRSAGIELHEGDDAPASPPAPRVEVRGLAAGDKITLDGDHFTVGHVDVGGFVLQDLVEDGPDGEVKVYWSEVTETAPRTYVTRPVETTQEERKAARRDTKPAKAPRVAKTKPARLTPEPEADALTEHGKVCLVGQEREGAAWELFAADTRLPPASWDTGRKSYARIRGYNRAGKCVRDSRDEGGAS